MPSRVLRFILLLIVCSLVSAVPARAQAVSGVISGSIVDEQGGALPGVTLTVRNTESGTTRTTVTEADGEYRFAALLPGTYDMSVALAGFATTEMKGLTVSVGTEIRRAITMRLQSLSETVTVSGNAPVIETTKSEVAAVITQQQIDSLPVENRNATTLALLLPGSSTDTTRPRRVSVNLGGGGVNHMTTAYFVDGGMNWSVVAGETRVDVPQSVMREFKVNVSQANADVGGNTGGVVTVVTKSGTNLFSGEAVEFFRDKSLNTMNKYEQQLHDTKGTPKPEFRRNQFGVAAGGPIVKDKVHFYAAIERTKQEQAFTVNTGKPAFYSSLEGNFPSVNISTTTFLRGDAQLNANQSIFARYIITNESIDCETCGGTASAFSGSAIHAVRDSFVAGHTWVISSRALNEIRVQSPWGALNLFYQFAPGTTEWTKIGDFGPARWVGRTQVFNFPSLSWGSNTASIVTNKSAEFRDDFSLTAGKHSVKTGALYMNIPSPEDASGDPLGTWTFSTDQFFNPSDPNSFRNLRSASQFTASFPGIVRDMKNKWFQAYVQDEWKPRTNLTLNYGLRYDLQFDAFNQSLDMSMYPRPLPYVDFKARGDKNNWGPRLGLSWDRAGDGKSVLRAGYGRYYQYLMQTVVRGEYVALRQTSIIIRNPTFPDPYGGKDPLSFASTAPPNITIVDNGLKNSSADTLNAGFSHELAANLAVHLDAIYTKMQDITQQANINTPNPATGVRPLPEWGRITQVQSAATHTYKAFYVRLDKRYSARTAFTLSYTLAKQDNTTGQGLVYTVTDFYNRGLDYGPSDGDRRHSLVASGSVLLPYGVQLGAVWTLRSSGAFSSRTGIDLNADGATTDFVPGTTRNMGNRDSAAMLAAVNAWRATRGQAPIPASQLDNNRYNGVNLRASKTFGLGGPRKIDLIAQVFNVFGTDNLKPAGATWVENANSDSFGRILQAQNRQQAEVAIRFAW